MRGSWVGIVFAAFLLLSGCTDGLGPAGEDDGVGAKPADSGGGEPGGSPRASPPGTTPVAAGGRLDLVDCRIHPMAFVVEREKAAPYVPEPYSTGTGAGGSIGLQIYLCQAVVLDNQTVLKDVAFAVSGIPVNVPEELAGEPGTGHAYVPELLANGPLASYFSAAGFPVTDATIIATEETGLDATVTVDGSTWYRALGVGRHGERGPVTAVLRHHHADGQRVVWFDAERTYQAVSIGDTVLLDATAGVLYDVSTAPGKLTGTSSAGYVNATFRFGEAP